MHRAVYVFIKASFLETTYKYETYLPSKAFFCAGKGTGIINS
jgi:hypothetical protein